VCSERQFGTFILLAFTLEAFAHYLTFKLSNGRVFIPDFVELRDMCMY
jgi:hypothetical protein